MLGDLTHAQLQCLSVQAMGDMDMVHTGRAVSSIICEQRHVIETLAFHGGTSSTAPNTS